MVIQRQMIFWTLVLVVALGAVIATTSLQPPTAEASLVVSPSYARLLRVRARKLAASGAKQNAVNPATATSLSSTAITVDSRVPASNPAQPLIGAAPASAIASAGAAIGASAEVSLACSAANRSELENGIGQVRISGKACAPGKIIESTVVHNISNGASATLFYPTEHSYMTDYLTLSPGENKIRIAHVFKGGEKEEREYVFERKARPPVED